MKRIQRQRTKGWQMPDGAKYVGRPTKYGNPFRLTPDGFIQCYSTNRKLLDPWIMWTLTGGRTVDDLLKWYDMWIHEELMHHTFLPLPPDVEKLRGFDLACFCPLKKSCHVDILLKILYQE